MPGQCCASSSFCGMHMADPDIYMDADEEDCISAAWALAAAPEWTLATVAALPVVLLQVLA